ncbi:MAG: hypothetical protein J6W42_09365 [Bacteroidaceae bacterium]|nr:hypothetical protein [Bacteroidaceae bacterium]
MRSRFIFLLAFLPLCVSCLKEDNSYKTPQAAITSFTIGYYNVRVHDINWYRRDTLVNIREGGVMYPMTIDQVNNRIYNIDSLAYGSDISGVTTSVYGLGTIGYSYDDDPGITYLWNSADSIDFTRKLTFSVVSTDGSYTRKYQVEVNVRKVFPDSLLWEGPDTAGFPVLSGISPVIRDDTVFCFGLDTTGVPAVSFRPVSGGAWNGAHALSGLAADGWQHRVTVCGNKFYSVSGGTLYGSSDGLEWNSVRTGIKSVIVSCDDYGVLWAVSGDSNIVRSQDMEEWTTVQRVPEHFPDSAASLFSYPLSTNTMLSRSVLAGPADDTLYSSVWTMLSGDTVWTEIDAPARIDLRLPVGRGLSFLRYDDALFCVGQGLDGFRQSNDNGVTWYKCDSYAEDYSSWNKYMQLPSYLKGDDVVYAAVTDRKGYIWIMTENGQVWHGAINRLIKK